MDDFLYADITYQIRGACFWVWKEFRSTHKESVIDRALNEELRRRGLVVDEQKRIDVFYRGKKVGTYVPNKVVNDKVIVELKRKAFLTKQDMEQFWHYLKGSRYKLGLLVNFGNEKLEIRRVVYDKVRIDQRVDQRELKYICVGSAFISSCNTSQLVAKMQARNKLVRLRNTSQLAAR